MVLNSHIIHLLILGLSGSVFLIAVLAGRNPLAEAPVQVRRLTVLFWLIFFLLETLDVLENPSGAPGLLNAWAVIGMLSGALGSLLMLRVPSASNK